jgi:hypothetical protein
MKTHLPCGFAIADLCDLLPEMALDMVIQPCQPVFGKAGVTGDERGESVAEHTERWLAGLRQSSRKHHVEAVHGHWASSTFYSYDQNWNLQVWFVVSAQAKIPNMNKVKHMFGNCNIIRRGAFDNFQQALPCDAFQNWNVPLGFQRAGSRHRNKQSEHRQWFSGQEFQPSLLQMIIADSKLQPEHRVLAAEGVLCDDDFARAVLHQNSYECKQVPQFGYCEVTWIDPRVLTRDVIVENVQDSMREKLEILLRKQAFIIDAAVRVPEIAAGGGGWARQAKCQT